MSTFQISDEAFEYLTVQVGELDNLKSVRKVWESAYERNTVERINNLLPHLPDKVGSILDIGSGLGGIDILLYRWYDEKPTITLLDGAAEVAKVEKHAEPFNSASVALDFQTANGVKAVTFMDYKKLKPGMFDIVLSFRAWCFHIAPSAYMDYVKRSIHPGSMVIVDVRKEPDGHFWREQLEDNFRLHGIIESGSKHERWLMKQRAPKS